MNDLVVVWNLVGLLLVAGEDVSVERIENNKNAAETENRPSKLCHDHLREIHTLVSLVALMYWASGRMGRVPIVEEKAF